MIHSLSEFRFRELPINKESHAIFWHSSFIHLLFIPYCCIVQPEYSFSLLTVHTA